MWSGVEPFSDVSLLTQAIRDGKLALWSESMQANIQEQWDTATSGGTGIQKKQLIEKFKTGYGEKNMSIVMAEMSKIESITPAAQGMYTEMTNAVNLNTLNLSERDSKENRKNVGIIFDDELTIEKLKREVVDNQRPRLGGGTKGGSEGRPAAAPRPPSPGRLSPR